MRLRLSIRGVLATWVLVGGAAILGLVVVGLASTGRLASQGEQLLGDLVPAQAANRNLALAVTGFVGRQSDVLAARNPAGLEQLPERDALERHFAAQRDALAAGISGQPGAAAALDRLDAAYTELRAADSELLQARSGSLALAQRLGPVADALDAAAEEIRTHAEAIAGRLAFGAVLEQRRLRMAVESLRPDPVTGDYRADGVDQLAKRVTAGLDSEFTAVQKASTALRANALALSGLGRQMMLESSPDMLLSLRHNRIAPLVAELEQNQEALTTIGRTHPKLTEAVAGLGESGNRLVALLVGGDQSVFEIRQAMLEQQAAMPDVLQRAAAARAALGDALDLASGEVARMADESAAVSAAVVDDARTLLIGGGVAAGALVLLFSGLVFGLQRRISGVLADVTRALSAAADGDLGQRLSRNGASEFAVLVDAFNRFAENTRALIGGIDGSSKALGGASSTLADITRRTSGGSRRQQQATDQVASAMEQMGSAVQEVARHAGEAAAATAEADRQCSEVRQAVVKMQGSIGELSHRMEGAAEVVNRVESDSHNIGSILDVIGNISEQTNLLALNAAIEAARAGDHGRGFSVVADEVRTLAARAQQSTEEIRQMIEGLRGGTRSAVEAMSASTDLARASVADAEHAGTALAAITGAVGTIHDLNTRIAGATEEQSQVAVEMSRNLSSIRDIAADQVGAADETEQAGTELARLAEDLDQRVQHFRL